MVVPALKTMLAPRIQAGDHVERFVVAERLGVDEPRALRYEQHAKRGGNDPPCSGRLAGLRGAIRGRGGLRFEPDVIERGVDGRLRHGGLKELRS